MRRSNLLSFIPCHRRPDRSLHFRGKPLPLCARCTAIYASYLTLPIYAFFQPTLSFLVIGALLQIPMLIDGITQKLKWRESTNTLRVITGGLSGIGQCLIIWFFVDVVTNFWLS